MFVFNKAIQTLQTGLNNIVAGIKDQGPKSKLVINGKEYIENHLIAEGGYSYIYELTSNDYEKKKYALKRMNISSKDHLNQVKKEIKIWKSLSQNKHIVKLIDYELDENSAFILMELSQEGTLLNYILNKKEQITEIEALKIIYQIVCGLYYMHSQNPPIAHRDIKIENILKFDKVYKICDFGSCSTFVLDPNKEDSKIINHNFTLFEKHSTLYYRPPEMIDMYSKYIVNEKVDIWALGCVLYSMLFKKHPFQDAQKLTIISAEYIIPKNNYSEKIIDLIRVMLTPNPSIRPSSKDIVLIIQNWNKTKYIQLSDEVQAIKQKQINNSIISNNETNILSKEEIKNAQAKIQQKENNYDNSKDLFDFDNTNISNNTNSNKKDNDNNNNLFDFEWVDDNTNNKENKKEETNNMNSNNNDMNNKFPNDLFSFDSSETNKNNEPKQNSTSNNNNNWNIFEDEIKNNNPNNDKNAQKSNNTYYPSNNFGLQLDNNLNINFNPLAQGEKENNLNNNKSSGNNQDILSFFS